jgi:hypothetical protein
MICPKCNQPHDGEGWPVETPEGLKEGGCQTCWEKESAEEFWRRQGCLERQRRRLLADAQKVAARIFWTTGG